VRLVELAVFMRRFGKLKWVRAVKPSLRVRGHA
jgi:hypothetical protein